VTGRACVYTALIGSYEALNEQPVACDSDLDFICFTDDTGLTSDTWKVVQISPAWPTDLTRSSRAIKILGHRELAGYERTVWVDNSAVLLQDPAFLLSHVDEAPFALLDHWEREDVHEEFQAVLQLGLEDPQRLYEQLNAYSMVAPEVLEQKPYATTIMVRRKSDPLRSAMRTWMDHVLRYSRRDQLSINYVLAETGIPTRRIHSDLRSSHWASWPHTLNRNRAGVLRRPSLLTMPPPALANEIRRRELDLEADLERVSRERDLLRHEAEAASALAALDTSHWREEVHRLGEVLTAQHQEIVGLRSSRSWRVTSPLRALADRALGARHPQDP
jgi:hypothetical protein